MNNLCILMHQVTKNQTLNGILSQNKHIYIFFSLLSYKITHTMMYLDIPKTPNSHSTSLIFYNANPHMHSFRHTHIQPSAIFSAHTEQQKRKPLTTQLQHTEMTEYRAEKKAFPSCPAAHMSVFSKPQHCASGR